MNQNIVPFIAMLAIEGTRQIDGKVVIGTDVHDNFPTSISVDGVCFDLSEEEEVDPVTRYTLAHYFRRDPKN